MLAIGGERSTTVETPIYSSLGDIPYTKHLTVEPVPAFVESIFNKTKLVENIGSMYSKPSFERRYLNVGFRPIILGRQDCELGD
jgi:hypothetical protein